jgi:hypothetical protein
VPELLSSIGTRLIRGAGREASVLHFPFQVGLRKGNGCQFGVLPIRFHRGLSVSGSDEK